jgi:hypothetical protein
LCKIPADAKPEGAKIIEGYVVVPLSNSFVLPDEIGLAVLAARFVSKGKSAVPDVINPTL